VPLKPVNQQQPFEPTFRLQVWYSML
jgi:hypothetical protein